MHLIKRIIFLVSIIYFSSCSASKKPQVKRSPQPSPKIEETTSRPSSVSPDISKVIEEARSYIGTPYRYGGTTRAGMDCSGLMLMSFKAAGLNLPRTADAQSNFGKKSSLESLKEGDLVFFSAKKGHGKITHVGLVTEVNGKREVKFIHASTKLGVVENNIYSDYYRSIFVKARRPF